MAGTEEDSTVTTINDLHPDVLAHVLRRLDGPALATASCTTSLLRAISSQPDIWEHLCLSTWPSLRHPRLLTLISSFPNSHRSFFSDSYPFPHLNPNLSPQSSLPAELISAVDLYHRGVLVFSKVLETGPMTSWFLGSPFSIDALDRKDAIPQEAALSPEDLTMSWIVMDPTGKRAANLSSRRPVSVERHWYTGEMQVRFATVLADGAAAATTVVTCGGEERMHVREVSLRVEDMEGMCLNGRESLGILQGAMEGDRKGRGKEGEELAKRKYAEHVRLKEEKSRREGRLEAGCTAVGIGVFLAFLILLAFR